MGKTKRGKGTKLMSVVDHAGLPIAVRTESATPHEVTLVAATLEDRLVAELPTRLICDRAYDSDPLDAFLSELGIAMIPRTDTTAKYRLPRMAALCAGTRGAGRWSGLRLVGQLSAAGGQV